MWMFGLSSEKGPQFSYVVSHGSGAFLAPEPLGRVPFSTTRVFETLFSLN